MNTYIDCFSYRSGPTGLSLASQIGNIGRIATCAAGALSLALVAPTTVVLNQYDALYLFDGSKSEIVQVGAGGAIVGATTIPLQGGTQFAHAGGTAYCTDGSKGSLGQAIFEASSWVDDICNQSLWSTVYTGEILTLPTMRAAIDNQYNLHFRPRHFPITALTAVSIQTNQTAVMALDPTQAIIDSNQQTVDIPNVVLVGSTGPGTSQAVYMWQSINRQANAWLTITYAAGFTAANLPPVVKRATRLLTSEMFAQLENPLGVQSVRQGKRAVEYMSQRDESGESLLVKQARLLLRSSIAQVF